MTPAMWTAIITAILALLGIRVAVPIVKNSKMGKKLGWSDDSADTSPSGIDALKNKLVIFKEDLDSTVHFAALRRIHHYVDGLPEDQKAKGHEAISTLMLLVGCPPDAVSDLPTESSSAKSDRVAVEVVG